MSPTSQLLYIILIIFIQVEGARKMKMRRGTRGPSGSLQLLIPRNITEPDHTFKNTPCCQDTLRAGVCRSMNRRDPEKFHTQCRTSADFSFIQCCHSCHFSYDVVLKTLEGRDVYSGEELYDVDVDRMLQSSVAPCVDRRTARFCEGLTTAKAQVDTFIRKSPYLHPKRKSAKAIAYWRRPSQGTLDLTKLVGGIDQLRDVPCESSALAFRVCRKTCGYCSSTRQRAIVKFNASVALSPHLCQTLY